MKKRLAAGAAGLFALSVSAVGAATTSCSTVAACIFGSNTSSGVGVEGSSKSGFGISGVSTSGHGVNGISSTSFGVVGITTANATSTGTARAGVLGEDESTNKKAYNIGVAGTSTYGYGGSFTSAHGVGLRASTAEIGHLAVGYGDDASSGAYVVGAFDGIVGIPDNGRIDEGSNGAAGVVAYGEGSGELGYGDIFIGVGCSGNPTTAVSCADEASIDANGNAIFAGTVTQTGVPDFRTTSALGPDVAGFGAETAAPSIEDVGKARLRDGSAYVALDRTFASTIDPRVAYSVFITPEGDSNGLYTSQLSEAGFAVHENKSGRSSLVFDYRIVAKPLGAKAMHLPAMSQFHQLAKHAPAPQIKNF